MAHRHPHKGKGNWREKEDALKQKWSRALEQGYFDDDGNLRDLFVAREHVEPLARAMGGKFGLTKHQIRRYFNHCRWIESQLRCGGKTWGNVRADFHKLDMAAADAIAKKEKKIPFLFHDFIQCNVKAVHDERDFLCGFMPHFEALVGYGQKHLNDDRR
jgi:CRISPR type III-A-associated protein Csm2